MCLYVCMYVCTSFVYLCILDPSVFHIRDTSFRLWQLCEFCKDSVCMFVSKYACMYVHIWICICIIIHIYVFFACCDCAYSVKTVCVCMYICMFICVTCLHCLSDMPPVTCRQWHTSTAWHACTALTRIHGHACTICMYVHMCDMPPLL